jgi:hypothetical protein
VLRSPDEDEEDSEDEEESEGEGEGHDMDGHMEDDWDEEEEGGQGEDQVDGGKQFDEHEDVTGFRCERNQFVRDSLIRLSCSWRSYFVIVRAITIRYQYRQCT